LFIHPINLQGLAWESVAAALGADRRCLLPDLLGHGRSTARSPFGVDAWVDDLVAVLDHFDVPRCHAVGGSLGGALAVALAARAPERVVSIGAFGSTLTVAGEGLATVLSVLREFDRTCPPEQGKAMADRLGARFVSMPGVGHLPMLEAPEPSTSLLRDFLDAQETPG
jgi:pimeloyl-ACP methyl ester carboxylesterase